MIQLFRSNIAKQVAVVLFALLMVVFLLTSVDLSGLAGGGAVGQINGQTIDAQTYETIVQQQTDAAQRQSATALSLEDMQTVRDQVWEQFIQQRVLEEEYREYGLTTNEQEVADALRNNPPQQLASSPEFHTDGQFDIAKYQRWLTSPSAAPYVDGLGAQMREQILRSKLLTLVTADVYLSDAALWEQYRDANEMVKISLTAIIPRNLVPDTAVTVTNEEVESYFRENREEFARGNVAYLSAIVLPRAITGADTAAALERVRAARQEIVDGAPFAEVAARESSDPASANQGGDLGQWVRGQFDPAFDSVAFRIPLNTVSEPVLSSFGYHLIEVTSRQADTASGRHVLIPIEVSGENRDRLDARVDSLDRIAADDSAPEAFGAVAQALGLRVVTPLSVEEGNRVLLGTQLVPDAGVWAFQANEGDISPVIETVDAYYLFRLDSLQERTEPTLAAVRPAVEAKVRDQNRWEVARGIAQGFVKRLEEGSTPERAAAALNLAHREFGPFSRVTPPLDNPVLVGTAFGLETGERSGIIDTDDGLYVITALEQVPADSAAFQQQLDDFRLAAVRQARQERVRNYLASLRENAEVVDNRAEAMQRAAAMPAPQAL